MVGRPRGITERWIDYLLKRYPSLWGAVQLANSPITDLARDVRCSPLDAAKLKVQAIAASIPIRHASVELKPPVSPGQVPVSLPYSDDTIDVTPENQVAKQRTPGVAASQRVVMLGFGEDNDG
jgi:hypothetical protein